MRKLIKLLNLDVSKSEAILFLIETKHTAFLKNGKPFNKLPKKLPVEEVHFIVTELFKDIKKVVNR